MVLHHERKASLTFQVTAPSLSCRTVLTLLSMAETRGFKSVCWCPSQFHFFSLFFVKKAKQEIQNAVWFSSNWGWSNAAGVCWISRYHYLAVWILKRSIFCPSSRFGCAAVIWTQECMALMWQWCSRLRDWQRSLSRWTCHMTLAQAFVFFFFLLLIPWLKMLNLPPALSGEV